MELLKFVPTRCTTLNCLNNQQIALFIRGELYDVCSWKQLRTGPHECFGCLLVTPLLNIGDPMPMPIRCMVINFKRVRFHYSQNVYLLARMLPREVELMSE